jgi:hypothetical protein
MKNINLYNRLGILLNILDSQPEINVSHAMIDRTDTTACLAIEYTCLGDAGKRWVIRAYTSSPQISVWAGFHDEDNSDDDPEINCESCLEFEIWLHKFLEK